METRENAKIRLVATCMFGLEGILGSEIDALGCKRLESMDGRVIFEADMQAVVYCNIRLRYAERLLILVGSFEALTFDGLFEGTKALCWEQFIKSNDEFPVKGHSVKSALFSERDCQRIIKKATADRLSSVYRTSLPENSGIKYQIEFFIFKDRAMLMIDTSGEGLHKRGYRTKAGIAPLKETLAAAMVEFSRPREGVIICDPLCGSGTIAIEAALLVTNTAPGLYRSFEAEKFPFIDKCVWQQERDKAKSEIIPAPMEIYGSDTDPEVIQTAKENAVRAGVADITHFSVADVKDFKSPVQNARGTIVTNPPYGERIGDEESVRKLYAEMGAAFERSVPMWQMYVIARDEFFERFFGRRANKIRRMWNGMIKCNYYQFFRR